MENQDHAVASVVSASLKELRKKVGFSSNVIADLLGIKARTFESYLYGQCVPSVTTVTQICNHFRYSVNSFLEPLICHDTEQQYIHQICTTIQNQTELRRDRICYIFQPIISGMSAGLPLLAGQDIGKKIRILREDSGISLSVLADAGEITADSLKQFESNQGIPGIKTLTRICNQLSVSPEYLLSTSLTYLDKDTQQWYSLTPRQLNVLSQSIERLCISLGQQL